jgi:UDP-N-acetylglucosamine--N-acetylmuramyl-(pentapeptide) pyrophosphoryl-undecaprenol N-acetylglucosamine transferase
MLNDRAAMTSMTTAAVLAGHPDAAIRVAEVAMEVARGTSDRRAQR